MATGAAAIRLDTADGSDEELRRLARWLSDEDELRGRVDLAHEPVRPGQMGGTADAVVVLLTSGTASALVSSLFAWLGHRREVSRVLWNPGRSSSPAVPPTTQNGCCACARTPSTVVRELVGSAAESATLEGHPDRRKRFPGVGSTAEPAGGGQQPH
ncbi:MAG: hypothetical protein LC635_05655 [Pseudonocardiaceae bacterium]|nr:hypothetical protein [Pseudonocardiaceae bacterium]